MWMLTMKEGTAEIYLPRRNSRPANVRENSIIFLLS